MTIDQELHRILLIDSYDSFTYKSVSSFRSTRETDVYLRAASPPYAASPFRTVASI